MKRRALAALGAAVAVLIGTAGCSTSPNGGAGGSGGSTTITFWTNNSGKVYDSIVNDFQKANPNITVKKTVSATNQFLQNMQVAATNKTLPDVFFEGLGATLAHKFIDNGLIMNLDQHAKDLNYSTRFSKLSLDTLAWKGHTWEAPHAALGMGLFYSKKAFSKAGITATPTTFAELEADAQKLKASGITPMSIGGKGSWMTMRFTDALIENFGGAKVHDSLYAPGANWQQPPVLKAFGTLNDWTKKGYFTPGFLSIDPTTDYISLFSGKAAMVLEGPWEDQTIIGQGQKVSDYGFFPFPADADGSQARLSAFAQGFMVAQNTKNKAAALKFLDYLTSDTVLKKYGGEIDGPVANTNVPVPAAQPNAATIKDLLGKMQGYLPSDQRFSETQLNTFFASQDSVVAGTKSPQQATASIQSVIGQ